MNEATGGEPAAGGNGGGEPTGTVTLGDTGGGAPAAGDPAPAGDPAEPTGDANFANYLDEGGDVAAYRKAMGLPDTATDYKLAFAEGFDVDAGTAQYLQEQGHALGISPKAMAKLAEGYIKRQGQMAEVDATKRNQERIATLQTEWGGDFDSKFDGAKRTANALCSSAGIDPSFLADPAIGGHPSVIKLMDHVSGLMREAKAAGIAISADMSGGLAECKRMESDPKHPLHEAYMNASHPDHARADAIYNKHMYGG